MIGSGPCFGVFLFSMVSYTVKFFPEMNAVTFFEQKSMTLVICMNDDLLKDFKHIYNIFMHELGQKMFIL